jgi:hypothetical protein
MNYYLFDDKLIIDNVKYREIGTDVAIKLLELKNQIKILHWQTTKYSEHKTLDKLFELLSEKNDRWVETFMGKYGRILLSAKGDTLELKNMKNDHGSTIIYLKDSVECLRLLRDKYFNKSEDSDLSNIFDEIFSDLNRACYLLTLD